MKINALVGWVRLFQSVDEERIELARLQTESEDSIEILDPNSSTKYRAFSRNDEGITYGARLNYDPPLELSPGIVQSKLEELAQKTDLPLTSGLTEVVPTGFPTFSGQWTFYEGDIRMDPSKDPLQPMYRVEVQVFWPEDWKGGSEEDVRKSLEAVADYVFLPSPFCEGLYSTTALTREQLERRRSWQYDGVPSGRFAEIGRMPKALIIKEFDEQLFSEEQVLGFYGQILGIVKDTIAGIMLNAKVEGQGVPVLAVETKLPFELVKESTGPDDPNVIKGIYMMHRS